MNPKENQEQKEIRFSDILGFFFNIYTKLIYKDER
jgi:hypothetical protein